MAHTDPGDPAAQCKRLGMHSRQRSNAHHSRPSAADSIALSTLGQMDHSRGHVFQDYHDDDDQEQRGLLSEGAGHAGSSGSRPRASARRRQKDDGSKSARCFWPSRRWRRRAVQEAGRSIAVGQGGTYIVCSSTEAATLANELLLILSSDIAGHKHPTNTVRNQKYSLISFLPLVLYEQFKFFFNAYFLLVALSQFIPALKIGFLATYIAPLSFVLAITIGKEALDDFERFKRDRESNSTPYQVLRPDAVAQRRDEEEAFSRHAERSATSARAAIPSSTIKVGDLIVLHKNQRVPADMVLLKTWAGDQLPEREDATRSDDHEEEVPDERFVLDDAEGSGDEGSIENRFSDQQKARDARVEDPSAGGTCFIRTDQLDGETDWKLRVAVDLTQRMAESDIAGLALENKRAIVYAGPAIKDIHTFAGTFTLHPPAESRAATPPAPNAGNLLRGSNGSSQDRVSLSQQPHVIPLTAENVLWANTVLAAGSAIGMVVYTGEETRAVMNTSHPTTKVGLLDLEINRLSKILCGVTFALSVGLVALNGFRGTWWVYIFRFLILFSSIIPISLRVNLDMGKTVYARQIQSDEEIAGTIVRTSTLPEELGRIEYLLSDKTGTLTQNEMELKKLHMGTMSYGWDSMDEVVTQLQNALGDVRQRKSGGTGFTSPTSAGGAQSVFGAVGTGTRSGRRDMASRVKDLVFALALCHNVTPVVNDDGTTTYQASSPDEVAIVKWTDSVGLTLVERSRTSVTLRAAASGLVFTFDILEVFPFTSESKRMGIVIRERSSGDITFYQKGADVVMARIVAQNDWLEEECGNMAREGLRTLVVGRKKLTQQSWEAFESQHKAARVKASSSNAPNEDRAALVANVISDHLERDLELLGVTGVEDKLQDDVKTTLELLRNAGIKVWMLTGDKIETATCIAISSKLVSRGQYIHQVAKLRDLGQGGDQSALDAAVRDLLEFLRSKLDCCLVIDGDSLALCMEPPYRDDFIELATQLSAVVACRCSPTQKADVARQIRSFTRKRVACIGDGGNDVSMILAADVGLGIVGKEGMQASLAADFSIRQFSHVTKLLVWHGRNSYKRSAKLAQFVIHRGLIISIIQAVFSSIFYFAPIALYQGWLMVGYATVYTMAPVFSLVLDRDVSEDLALLYPELYRDLTKGRSLTAKTFASWLAISVYQGGAIMILSLALFENEFLNIVAISFTALVLNELIMVALEVTTWHTYMVLSEVVTLALYAASMTVLPEYFSECRQSVPLHLQRETMLTPLLTMLHTDLSFVLTTRFLWKTAVIVAVSSFPLYILKIVRARLAPPSYSKLAMS